MADLPRLTGSDDYEEEETEEDGAYGVLGLFPGTC
jgi:hypothetical protein